MGVATDRATFGFNLVGHLTGNFGLATAARNTLKMFAERNVPVCTVELEAEPERLADRRQFYWVEHTERGPAPYGINVFHTNPPAVRDLVAAAPPWLNLSSRLNVCVPFWELPSLPCGWPEVLGGMDAVLCPSRFVMDAVHGSAREVRTIHYQQAVFLPEGIVPRRSQWGFAQGSTIFLTTFDLTGDLDRKNPEAALSAFRSAFPRREGVELVVKVHNADFPGFERQRARLVELCAGEPNVRLVDKKLQYSEMLNLMAASDVVVSLHRSEGLGLHLLEAMSLGKPVIATAWSGNMDFMDEGNSCMVGYRLVPVLAEHPAYQRAEIGHDQRWAEPKIAAASEWMKRLADDPELRRSIGAKAIADMDGLRERFMKSGVVDELQQLWGSGEVSTHSHRSRARRLQATGSVPINERLRRLYVAMRRRS